MPNIGKEKNLIGRKLKKPNKTPKKPINPKKTHRAGVFKKKNPGFCQPWLLEIKNLIIDSLYCLLLCGSGSSSSLISLPAPAPTNFTVYPVFILWCQKCFLKAK
jgi:hypothetical protein